MTGVYADYEWFLKEDLNNYSGKWLAILDKKIVASGTDLSKVLIEVKKDYPNKKPMITKVKNTLSILTHLH